MSTTALIGLGCASSDPESMSAGELALQRAGSDLDGSGPCAAIAQINQACPPDLAWDNHGQYVSCVARYLSARVEAGDIDEADKGELVSLAARSAVGKKKAGKHGWPAFGDCDDPDDGSAGSGGFAGHGDDDHDDGGAGQGYGGADQGYGGADQGYGGADQGYGGAGDGGQNEGGCAGDDQVDAGGDSSWGGHP